MDLRADAGGERLDALNHVAELTVADGDFHGRGGTQDRLMDYRTVLVDHSWSLEAVPEIDPPESAFRPLPERQRYRYAAAYSTVGLRSRWRILGRTGSGTWSSMSPAFSRKAFCRSRGAGRFLLSAKSKQLWSSGSVGAATRS